MNANPADTRAWADVLAELPLFDGVGRRQLRKIVRDADVRDYSPGETIVATGGAPDSFYVVLGGEATAAWKPAGRPLRRGAYFGEIGLLDDAPRSASVVATTELQVMRLPRRTFDRVLDRHPSIARTLLAELGSRVRELERQAARRTI